MEIRIMIVDDNANNTKRVMKAVKSFESIYEPSQIIYKIIDPFETIYAFSNARDYIISSQKSIDILLVDYHLIRGLGTDLFKLIKPEFQIYKILHSETRDSMMESKRGLSRNEYDDFCYTKEPETIHEALKTYELEILSIRLFGNPEFRDKYFININEGRLSSTASDMVRDDVRIFDILYVLSEGDDLYTICFRSFESGEISNLKKRKFQISGLITDLYFRKVNNQTIINLLWVASIDKNSRTISFITSNNELCKINYLEGEPFNIQIAPNMQKIKQGIPNFFRN